MDLCLSNRTGDDLLGDDYRFAEQGVDLFFVIASVLEAAQNCSPESQQRDDREERKEGQLNPERTRNAKHGKDSYDDCGRSEEEHDDAAWNHDLEGEEPESNNDPDPPIHSTSFLRNRRHDFRRVWQVVVRIVGTTVRVNHNRRAVTRLYQPLTTQATGLTFDLL